MTIRTERRQLQMVRAEGDAPQASRTRTFIASNDTVDSYNTRVIASGIQLARYERNSVILLHHNMRSFPIGVGRASIEGNALRMEVEFGPADDPVSGPEAEQALRWLDRGVMGMSIGFDVLEATYVEERETGDPWRDLFYPPEDYTVTELFEASIVSVPSNPDALPVGRSQRAQQRLFERLARPSATDIEKLRAELAEKDAQLEALRAPKTEVEQLSPQQLSEFIDRIAKEERAKQEVRRRGRVSR